MNTLLAVTFVSSRHERCYLSAVSKVSRALILGILVLGLESCHLPSYAKGVHPHGELALAGYNFSNGAQSARAFFVRKFSMRSHVMAELERDTFECAGNRLSLSANPFQLRHPHHLAVIGEAPLNSSGAH